MIKKTLYSLAVSMIALLVFTTPLSMKDFYTRGEAREAIEVPEMFEQDNFILPLKNGGDIPSKPPMYHWLAAASSSLLGSIDEFSIRLPAAFLSASLLGFFFFFVFQISNLERAIISTLILSTSLEWIRSSSHARVDIAFAFWLTLACLSFYLGIERQKRKASYAILCYFLAALTTAAAVLSKGPAAFILIAAIADLYILLDPEKNLRSKILTFPYVHCIFAGLIALLIAGSWYYFAYELYGEAFLHKQIFQENIARLMHEKGENPGHKKPFYFSIILLIQGFLPWSLFFPVILLFLFSKGKELLRIEDSFFRFSLIWLGIFLMAVTASISKRSVYLLPAYPALSYILAYTIEQKFERKHWLQKLSKNLLCSLRAIIMLITIIFLILVVIDVEILPFELNQNIIDILRHLYLNYEFALLTLASLMLLLVQGKYLKEFEKRKIVQNLAFCVIILSFVVNSVILPAVSEKTSPKKFASMVRDLVPSDQKIYQYSDEFYALVFYLDKPLYAIKKAQELRDPHVLYIVIKENEYKNTRLIRKDFHIIAKSNELAGNGRDKLLLVKRTENKVGGAGSKPILQHS